MSNNARRKITRPLSFSSSNPSALFLRLNETRRKGSNEFRLANISVSLEIPRSSKADCYEVSQSETSRQRNRKIHGVSARATHLRTYRCCTFAISNFGTRENHIPGAHRPTGSSNVAQSSARRFGFSIFRPRVPPLSLPPPPLVLFSIRSLHLLLPAAPLASAHLRSRELVRPRRNGRSVAFRTNESARRSRKKTGGKSFDLAARLFPPVLLFPFFFFLFSSFFQSIHVPTFRPRCRRPAVHAIASLSARLRSDRREYVPLAPLEESLSSVPRAEGLIDDRLLLVRIPLGSRGSHRREVQTRYGPLERTAAMTHASA